MGNVVQLSRHCVLNRSLPEGALDTHCNSGEEEGAIVLAVEEEEETVAEERE